MVLRYEVAVDGSWLLGNGQVKACHDLYFAAVIKTKLQPTHDIFQTNTQHFYILSLPARPVFSVQAQQPTIFDHQTKKLGFCKIVYPCL